MRIYIYMHVDMYRHKTVCTYWILLVPSGTFIYHTVDYTYSYILYVCIRFYMCTVLSSHRIFTTNKCAKTVHRAGQGLSLHRLKVVTCMTSWASQLVLSGKHMSGFQTWSTTSNLASVNRSTKGAAKPHSIAKGS